MPEVRPLNILSFSSEDKDYPADNLLKVSAFSKWKCYKAGSKHSSVSFKFACPIQFSRIDICNEASAFILAEVSRADSSEFEILLPSSSFMSPVEAKKGIRLNRVRIFSSRDFTPAIAAQKWDIVRVICTQPFNEDISFGLAFIRFYCAADAQGGVSVADSEEENESKKSDEMLKPGGLFQLSKKNAKVLGMSVLTNGASIKTAVPATVMDPQKATSSTADGATTSGEGNIKACQQKRKILHGVVIAFSGYQNPFRADLRKMCLKLGGKYRQDWSDDCTHLICAFPNTPKWNLVKGKAIIVSHKWIQACNAAQQRVSWRPYRVGRAPSPVGHVSDDDGNAATNNKDSDDSDWERSIVEDADSDEWRPDGSGQEDEGSDESSYDSNPTDELSSEDESHSDETRKRKAITPVLSKLKAPLKKKRKNTKNDTSLGPLRLKGKDSMIDDDAKEENQKNSGNKSPPPLPPLPDFFVGKRFFIFPKDFDANAEEDVNRLIITFGGKIESYMNSDVNFVVSQAAWCDDFDDALEVCPSLIFVKPEWIYACDKAGKLVAFQRYQIVG